MHGKSISGIPLPLLSKEGTGPHNSEVVLARYPVGQSFPPFSVHLRPRFVGAEAGKTPLSPSSSQKELSAVKCSISFVLLSGTGLAVAEAQPWEPWKLLQHSTLHSAGLAIKISRQYITAGHFVLFPLVLSHCTGKVFLYAFLPRTCYDAPL